MINRLDNAFIEIFDRIKSVLGPIILIILIITIFKIMFDYKKYGKKIFFFFKRRREVNISKESLEISIKNLNGYYKVIKLDKKSLILILECGIYVIYLLDYDGIISGDINKEKLTFKMNTEKEDKIINPVYVILKEIEKLKCENFKCINGYILLKRGCIFSVLNRTDVKVIPANAFYYHFSHLINEKVFNKKEIDEIYEKIVK